MSFEFQKVTVIGLGLIGGSLAWRLKGSKKVNCVYGVDKDAETIKMALSAGAVHMAGKDIEKGVAGAEIVVMAVPVSVITGLVKTILPHIQEGCVITDVGSTKETIVSAMERLLPAGLKFLGGHPMSGSERSGFQAADSYLFENAVYALTPTHKTPDEAIKKIISMVEILGARPVLMDPATHDRIVATVSHLPHVLAAALVNAAAELNKEESHTLTLSAGGFRDTTRVAGSNPELWVDICLANKKRLKEAILRFQKQMDALCALLEGNKRDQLLEWLRKAQTCREQIPREQKGILPPLYELLIAVPDRPGIIGEVASALGRSGSNISDIEILRVREGEKGSIRIAFATAEERAKAEQVLSEKGIEVYRR